MNKRRNLSGGGLRLLPWLAVAAALLLSVGSLALYGEHNIDSDMSNQLVLADLLNDEGGLLTDSWYYGNELNVISMIPAFQLGLRLFPQDWHAAHVLGVAVMQLVLAASFLFMVRGFGMREGGVWAAAAVLAPFSFAYLNLSVYNGNYAGFSAAGFLIVGLLARVGKRRWLWLLLAALSLYSGLQGVRLLMMLGAPLLLACLAEAFGALRRSESPREAARSKEARYFAGACVVLAGMCVGYLINSRVFSKIYDYNVYGDTAIGALNWQLFLSQIECLLEFFGFRQGMPYLSAEGVLSLLGLGLAVMLIVLSAVFAARRGNLAPEERLFATLSLMCVALGIAINVLSKGMIITIWSPSYFMIGIQCMIASAFFLLERMTCRMKGVRTLAMAALCGAFLLEGLCSVQDLQTSETNYERTANYLRENGYTQGFSTFWGSNVLTEASDGEIEVWTLRSYQDGVLSKCLQKKDHLTRDPQGRVFAVAQPGDAPMGTFEPHLLEEFNGVRIYGFESAQAFWNALNGAIAQDADMSDPNAG